MSEKQKIQQNVKKASAVEQSGENAAKEIDLAELAYRLLASWKLIICVALLGAMVAGAYTMFFVTLKY